jgi:hypothetical protein
MGTHLPLRGEQIVCYYGEFSNCLRRKHRKAEHVEAIPIVLEPEISAAETRENWSRLIQKVYEADPLVCSRCQGRLKVIRFIEDRETIRKILEHLGLWLANARPTPRAHSLPGLRPLHEDSFSQLPAREEEDYCQAPPPHWDF